MSDEVDSEEEEAEVEAPKGGRRKLFIIAGAAVLVLALGGGGAWFFLSGSSGGSSDVLMAEMAPTYYYDIPSMTVNLNSQDEEFLKLSVSLELKDETMVAAIQPRMARVVDAFQVYLRELRRSDLEGSAGIYRLKEELRRRVNLAIHPAEIDGILFREILVQ